MQVKDIMTHDPVCCVPENNLIEIARMMADCDCGAIPVVENQANRKPVGIITDRDIVIRGVAEGKDPFTTPVEECMTRSLVTVKADDDVKECEQLMEKHQLRRILVVDDKGAVTGIVVQAHIATKTSEAEAGEVLKEISQPSH